ncbi:SpoIIE family protein phosphatase [Streptomyces sp. NPDC007905]|uniref:SpoIIE family protein phosphatase n=1 Tax=Streptomyces sp. NPDC007905 TaxID=3364788 RepID=UPI0036EF1F35
MIIASLARGDDELWRLCRTNAGHPPPLLVSHDGRARYLTDARHPARDRTDPVSPRCLHRPATPHHGLLHTDGLVESPHRSIDHGLDRLRRHVASLARCPVDSFCYWSRSAPATTTTTSPCWRCAHPPSAFV